jgi:hypothetical protein
MPLYDLELYLFKLKNDPAMQKALTENPEQHLAAQGLDDDAKAALLSRDVQGLWKLGVHPLLMAPLSRFFGMQPADYRAQLKPLINHRTFRS